MSIRQGDKIIAGASQAPSDVYTKSQIDELLENKQDVAQEGDYYITDKVFADAMATKAQKADTLSGYGITDAYTKTETESLIATKADKADTYTKQEVDEKLTQTGVDLSSYLQKSEAETIYATKEENETKVDKIDGYSLISSEKLAQIDTNKSDISTNAFNIATKISSSEKGVANGVVPLNSNTKISDTYLNNPLANPSGHSGQYLKSTGSSNEWASVREIPEVTEETNGKVLKSDGSTYYWGDTAEGDAFDYEQAVNKPSINGTELNGNKTLSDLGIQAAGDYAYRSTVNTLSTNLNNLTSTVNGLSSSKQDKLTAGDNVSIVGNTISVDVSDLAPSNMVTTDTEQTISGAKTFSTNVTLGSNIRIKSSANEDIIYADTSKATQVGSTSGLLYLKSSQAPRVIRDATYINIDSGNISEYASYPVTSVNTKTGDVVLSAEDIKTNYTYNEEPVKQPVNDVLLSLQTQLDTKQSELTAGSGITIEDNTVSAAVVSVNGATGEVNVTGDSVHGLYTKSDETVVRNTLNGLFQELYNTKQDTLIAGDGITIIDNTIYATGAGGGGEGGTSNYTLLINKPQINSIELNGNKTSAELGLTSKEEFDTLSNTVVANGSTLTALNETVTNLSTNKQDKLVAGDGITIEGNVISSTSTGGGGGSSDADVVAALKAINGNSVWPRDYVVNNLTQTEGTVMLVADQLYVGNFSGQVYIQLPTVIDTSIRNQIEMQFTVTSDANIDWGEQILWTNGELPIISEGVYYRAIFEYDNNSQKWSVGVVANKELVEA